MKRILSSCLVVALSLASDVSALGWFGSGRAKRDTAPAVFVPQRVNVPLRYDENGRYVTNVIMSTQSFNFTMSTGTGLTYVAGTNCTLCGGVSLYNQSASPTAQSVTGSANIPFFNSTTSASIIRENCSLAISNGSTWAYPNQTVVVMNQKSTNSLEQTSGALVGMGVSGLVGLGTNRGILDSLSPGNQSVYNATFTDSIYGQWLLQHPTALNFSFGIQMNPPIAKPVSSANASNSSSLTLPTTNDAGILHWLQPDPSAYDTNQLSYVSVADTLSVSSFATDPQDWIVSLDGWMLASGENQVTNRKSVLANVDPLYSGIYLPLDQARLLHDGISGAIALPTTSTLGSLSQSWRIPCDSKFTFGIIVGTQTYTLDTDALIIKMDDGTCVSGIEAWTQSDVNQYLLGARFMSTIYLIFTVPRNGPHSIGFAPRAQSSGKKTNVGAIVGGTIGGVALLLLGALIGLYFYIRHKRSRSPATPVTSQDSDDKYAHNSIEPFTLSQSQPSSPSYTDTTFQTQQTTIVSHTRGSTSIIDSEPSPSQLVFLNSQISTPLQSPQPGVLFAMNAEGSAEERPPAYEEDPALDDGVVREQSRDVKEQQGSSSSRMEWSGQS